MNIPMFDLNRKLYRFENQIQDAFKTVLQSGNLVLGKQVQDFEYEFAQFLGVDFCIGVGNGTDALEIALKSLQLKKNSTVLTVANAGGYATTSIINSALNPRFVEIDYKSGNTNLEYCMKADLTNVTAVVLTHLYGNPVEDTEEIINYFNLKGIRTIEDCAQSTGARYKGKFVGTFADISCFSFYPTKNLGCIGDGGAIVTNKSELAIRTKKLRTYGWSQKYEVELGFGRNSRLDEIQAACLRVFLPKLESDNMCRTKIAQRYQKEISVDGVLVALISPKSESVYHLFVLITPYRNELIRHLREFGVSSAIHYPIPDMLQPGFKSPQENLSNTEDFTNHVVSIPIFPEMLKEEIDQVIAAVNCFSFSALK
jgi:dTDP-4-amino-4,6-dideoxygalactose transaminase